MHVVSEPKVPFTTPIYEPLRPGSRIEVTGKAHGDFVVELLSGPNIILHINFRSHTFGEHALVVNASSNGMWGQEVRSPNPIRHHEHFNISIEVQQAFYMIRVNGQMVAEFQHRFPFETAQALGVRGDVHCSEVRFEGFDFGYQTAPGVGWGSAPNYDYGHGGYMGYGTDSYQPPQFNEGHRHHHRHHYDY